MKAVLLKPTIELESYLKLGQVWGLMKDDDQYRIDQTWYGSLDRLHNYQVDEYMQSPEFRLQTGQKILFMTAGDLDLGAGWVKGIRMVDLRQLDVLERPGIEYVVSLWDVINARRATWAWMITYEME